MAEVNVKLPIPLRKYADGQSSIKVNATTVYEAIMGLNNVHESMSMRLLDSESKAPRQYIKIYLGGKDIRGLNGLHTTLHEDSSIDIVTAFAGG